MRKTGILIIGHGSSNPSWVEMVDQAVQELKTDAPIATCFLEMVEGRLIEDGIRALEEQGVERIVAIPLFVASGSTHIDEIGCLLGVQSPNEAMQEEGIEAIPTKAEIVYCPPMDDHPLILDILEQRIGELTVNPGEETLLLVGHGADDGEYHAKWEQVMQSMAVTLRKRFGFKGVSYGTLHPDNLRSRAEALSRKNKTIVVPLFLSEGYFTKRVIPSRLEGLSYTYSGKTYLPHPNISHWLQDVIDRELQENCQPTN